MKYIVGLDLGTHQTKVCIEDSSNHAQLKYEFLEFPGAGRAESILLPSVVQINKDDTVSYGFVSQAKAKKLKENAEPEPVKAEVPKPVLEDLPQEPWYQTLPEKPAGPKGYLAVLAKLLPKTEEEKEWERMCATVKKANEDRRMAWQHQTQLAKKRNNDLIEAWKQQCSDAEADYKAAYKLWEKEMDKGLPLRFRYFKQATYLDKSVWQNDFITPECACIWYLAYIRFLLNEKLGEEYIVRMGVPCSYKDIEPFRQRAYDLWKATEAIVAEYKTLKKFLKAKYTDLLPYGKYHTYEIDYAAPFDVRTEAQAGLFAVVSNHRLDTRINLLYDIGGGSTDVSVFHITPENLGSELKILDAVSIPYGLNHIFEEYKKDHPNLTLEDIQTLFYAKSDSPEFRKYVENFNNLISGTGKELARAIVRALIARGLKQTNILSTLASDPCVFAGGGSLYPELQNIRIGHPAPGQRTDSYVLFQDKRLIDGKLLGVRNVANNALNSQLYTILAISYGLSLSSNFYEVDSEDILATFANEQLERVVHYPVERNDDD